MYKRCINNITCLDIPSQDTPNTLHFPFPSGEEINLSKHLDNVIAMKSKSLNEDLCR